MRQRVWKYCLYLCLGFLVFFIFRLSYGYTAVSSPSYFTHVGSTHNAEAGEMKKNYASSKIRKDNAGSAGYIEQKFEKVGSFFASSDNFDTDNKKVRQDIATNKAVIQYENNNGIQGHRSLYLSIGVAPELFDVMCEEVQKIGHITHKNISKTDKTNEFKNLNAKRASLEKLRNSLLELKGKGGKIDEFITLENRILEIEEQLQDLGVSLGDFDQENELCTIRFTLTEHSSNNITFIHRVLVALQWTLKYYALFVLTLLCITTVCYICILAYSKLKTIKGQ